MIFEKYLIPDVFFDDIYQITPEFLVSQGIKGLVLDIDNTLVTYDDPVPTEGVLAWFKAMEAAGIKMAFVSNNSDPSRVNIFNRDLGYFALSRGGKPFGKGVRRAMAAMGTVKENTAIIGDQLLTDIMAGKCAGLKRSFLVLPIKDRTELFFRTKRRIEAPYIKKYKKIHAEDDNTDKLPRP